MLLSLFVSFYTPHLGAPVQTQTPSLSSQAPTKSPSLEANTGIKFSSRAQKTFKVKNDRDDNKDDNATETLHSGYLSAANQRFFRLKTSYKASTHAYSQYLLSEDIQPRAPPAIS